VVADNLAQSKRHPQPKFQSAKARNERHAFRDPLAERSSFLRDDRLCGGSAAGRLRSDVAGASALAIIMMMLVTRTTEEMIRLVLAELRDAILALGMPRWRTTLSVVADAATSGITTGSILAIARVAGEPHPYCLPLFGNRFWSTALTQPIASLTV
jgi:ABC-type phosphate transport system permease subunit